MIGRIRWWFRSYIQLGIRNILANPLDTALLEILDAAKSNKMIQCDISADRSRGVRPLRLIRSRRLPYCSAISDGCFPFSRTQKPTYLEICNMKISDLVLLRECTYEWEKGHGESRCWETDTFVIRFGSIETDLAPKKIEGDAEIL